MAKAVEAEAVEAPPEADKIPVEVHPRKTADEILALDDREYEDVFIPQWNTVITVRSMTGTERDRLEGSMIQTRGKDRIANLENMRARTVAVTAVDSNPKTTPGVTPKLLFRRDQVIALGQKNAGAIQLLYDLGARLSGISESDVQELTIELGNDPSDDTGSR